MNLYFILMDFMEMEEIMKNNKILFFFQSGRIARLNDDKLYAKEMFYGFHHFKDKKYNIEALEFNTHKTIFGKYFFLIFEKRLRNLLRLPLYWSFLTNKINLNKIHGSDYIVFSNNRVGCSAIPMLLISKLKGKNFKSLSFIMGLFSRKPKYKIFTMVQKFYIYLFLKTIDNFVFLSRGELDFAKEKFPRFKNKYNYLPFAVDLKIWRPDEGKKREYILFVGNDGNRDFELAEKISNEMTDESFVFLSEQIKKEKLKENSKIINGSWGSPAIDDIELRNIYQSARLTIIPLKESLQPSGQSVALQSMACGTPVLITETEGFWDKKNFKDHKNIFFAKNNYLQTWVADIKAILNLSEVKINKVISNGKETINKHYDLDKFSENIENILIN